MASVLAIFLALLVPVVALLFMNLRFARKLEYPHHLLGAADRSGPAAFLFRSFRTYYDILLDAFVALVLALAIAGELGLSPGLPFKPKKEAIVIDCSASMLLGRNGNRPLDLAMAWLERIGVAEEDEGGGMGGREGGHESDKAGDRAVGSAQRGVRTEVYALAFDPRQGRSRLVRLASLVRGASGEVAVTRLVENLAFFGVDYGDISRLREEGYGKITFLTDGLSPEICGIETVRFGGQTLVGRKPNEGIGLGSGSFGGAAGAGADAVFSAWPASIRFDREKGNWLAAFVQSLPPSSVGLERWDDARATFAKPDAESYRIESREYGWAFRISQPGIYRATATGPLGEGPLDFTFRLVEARRAGLASGPFSEAMMSVFPLVVKAPRPSMLFLDRGSGDDEESRKLDAAARDRADQAPEAMVIETRILQEDGMNYLPPAKTGGKPVLAEAESFGKNEAGDRARGMSGKQNWLFELGPAALTNPDLPLAYDGVLMAGTPPAFLVAPQGTVRGLGTDLDQAMTGKGGLAGISPLRGIIKKGRFLFVKDDYGLLPVIPPASEYFPAAATSSGTEPEVAAPPPVTLWVVLLGLAALAKILIWKRLGGGKRESRDT